jgi:ubiquinone/menaquinone biosynthesis C-methylase UbiE
MPDALTLQGFQRELVDIAERYQLLHCRSLISVRQYVPAYELVRKHVPTGGRVLDWGTGNGHFSYFLMRSGYKTSGFGFEHMPKVCGALGPGVCDYQRGSDPVRLPYDDHSFDAVLSIGVLEHVRETGGDESASLREIRRILKPGGVFICAHFPNRFSWIDFLARVLGRAIHRFTYTRSDILRLSADAGLRVVDVGQYGVLPRNLWSGRRLRVIGNWLPAADAYQLTDGILSSILRPVCQNYWFVASADHAR